MLHVANDKKILQIKKGEFLLDVTKDGILTTYKRDSAMDISVWSIDQLAHVTSNLHKVGYKSAKVIVIKGEEENESETETESE